MLPAVLESANRGAFAWADLAHAVEVGVVVLPRHVLADDAIAEGHVLAAEERGRGEMEIRARAVCSEQRESAGRSLLVEIAERVEDDEPLEEIRRDVGLQAIDLRRARERRVLRDEAGARADSSREEGDVAEIGRHPGRHVRRVEQRDPRAEDVER